MFPESSPTALKHFSLLALGQCVLIWLRSTVYCALSFSRDLQNQSVAVVRITPISPNQVLFAKLVASLAPLWMELLLFLPVSLLFFSVYLNLPVIMVLSTTLFLICLSFIAGTLGLAVGSQSSHPSQAIRNARLLTFFLLFFFPILKGISDSWTLPLVGLGLWLIVYSRRAPNRGTFLAVCSTVVGLFALFEKTEPLGMNVSFLHPVNVVAVFFDTDFLADSADQVWALYYYPAFVGGLYLLVAFVFFRLARLRFRYS